MSKELMRRMLFWSRSRVYTGRSGKAGAGIWRTAGRELMRSISESAGVRRMSGAEDNEISGGKWARRITIREEAKFNISGGKYARRITI